MSDVIFTTIHGSRLYGFASPVSDFDYFTVVASDRPTHQSIVGSTDSVIMGLNTFLGRVRSGSPQAVEALFSPVKAWGGAADPWRSMLEQTRITGPEVFAKYERTIRAFCYGDLKRRRHAARLSINLRELRHDGTMMPRISEPQNRWTKSVAEQMTDDKLAEFLGVDKP